MKIFFIGILLLFTVQPSRADQISPALVSLDEVVKKVSAENYNVYASALRVYQAREGIQVARGNLLPKLNLWRIAGVAVDLALGNYASPIGLVGDIAPFLVPANWFRYQESKVLYLAEQEGYRALWANELMTAKSLYVHLLLDQSLLEHIVSSEVELKRILRIVQSRELLGGIPKGASRDIEIRLLGLQEDKRAIEALVTEEESLLSYMMGYSANVSVQPLPIQIPEFEETQPLDYSDFEFRVVDISPELRQFDHFILAADSVRKEAIYSFLGTSSMSRGVAGGVFDSIPMQDGLGFGTPATMRIISAQKEILKTQRRGIEQTLKRHLKLLVASYNLDLQNYSSLKRREILTNEANNQLFDRLRLGQNVDSIELIEASKNHIQASTSFFAVKYRLVTNEDKLARLLFGGDYTKRPVVIEDLKETRK